MKTLREFINKLDQIAESSEEQLISALQKFDPSELHDIFEAYADSGIWWDALGGGGQFGEELREFEERFPSWVEKNKQIILKLESVLGDTVFDEDGDINLNFLPEIAGELFPGKEWDPTWKLVENVIGKEPVPAQVAKVFAAHGIDEASFWNEYYQKDTDPLGIL